MYYYLGMLHRNLKDVVVFRTNGKLTAKDNKAFVKVLGPYPTEQAVRDDLRVLKKMKGFRENPSPSLRSRYKKSAVKRYKNVMSPEKALRLTRKVMAHAKDIYKDYQENPGQNYHDQKFLQYMKELEKYKVGSVPYIGTLAKAYEHLESAKESMR